MFKQGPVFVFILVSIDESAYDALINANGRACIGTVTGEMMDSLSDSFE